MNEEIKNQMLINSDSYEFFLKQTREAERNFFKHSGKCIKHIQQVSEIAEDEGGLPSSRINIKKFKKAREAGEQFLVILITLLIRHLIIFLCFFLLFQKLQKLNL